MRRWPLFALPLATAIGTGLAAAPRQAAQIPTSSHSVAMLPAIAPPCISIGALESVTISLRQSQIEHLAAMRPVHAQEWRNERERLDWISGERAERLLRATEHAPRDALGCNAIALAQLPDGSVHLVAALIEAGSAAVSAAGRPGFAPTVTVIDVNGDCRNGPLGGKHYWLQDTRFLRRVTCVT